MSRVAIVTDSTAYIPDNLLKKYAIPVVPLILIWGEETYEDGVNMLPEEFYRRLPDSKVMPTTSQATIPSMQQTFTRLLENGFDVLGIFLSSKLSGTVQSALQAREMLDKDAQRVAVFDSLATTMAMGWPVLTAARAAEAGENLSECLKAAEKARDQTGVLFVVETLEFLRRGGRIGGAQALLGTALNIKPILELQEGRIESVEKIRTKGKALERMLDLAEEKMGGRTPIRLAAVHADAEADAIALLETAKRRFSPVETVLSPLSPVIGAHAGPGTVALAYMTGV
ncbi:MAG TPA: DegV family protein [Anaerolineales bacterium]|nr:DegV family protein [Anaerolineales bacterium]